MLPDNTTTDINSIFVSENFHTIHLGISNHTQEFIIYYLYSEDTMSHLGSQCGKCIPLRSYGMPMFPSSNHILEAMKRYVPMPGLLINFSDHETSYQINFFYCLVHNGPYLCYAVVRMVSLPGNCFHVRCSIHLQVCWVSGSGSNFYRT